MIPQFQSEIRNPLEVITVESNSFSLKDASIYSSSRNGLSISHNVSFENVSSLSLE